MSQGGRDVSRWGGPEERKVPRWDRMHVARNYLIPPSGAHESPTPPRGKNPFISSKYQTWDKNWICTISIPLRNLEMKKNQPLMTQGAGWRIFLDSGDLSIMPWVIFRKNFLPNIQRVWFLGSETLERLRSHHLVL